MTKLRVGDWVEVRSRQEILRTLDGNAQLDGMPFMPEMFAFCGQKFRVYKRAHKTCDTVFPVRGRRVDDAVHLETRCDGSAHDGCEAGCLIFWKEAWLKPADKNSSGTLQTPADSARTNETSSVAPCLESTVCARTHHDDPAGGPRRYTCQATQLPYATTRLEWWDVRQYLEDYSSGNVSLWQIISGAAYFFFYAVSQAGIGAGRPIRWLWDKFYPLWRGAPFPRRNGTIPDGRPTPTESLDLEPGELVRIKPYQEILKTLDARSKNRGLYFDAEEVPYCEKTYRVLRRVTKFIHDKTGQMRGMNTPSVILDKVICQSRYSECRLFCPRSIYPYWREIWLERADGAPRAANSRKIGEIESPREHPSVSR